ncbi:MAG: hypothetical protein P8X57_14825 [Cyclobacteriaceae bacterium]
MQKLPIIISVVLSLLFLAAHPIHVSVTDVEFVGNKKELQIIVRIFTDDLEKQIRSETGQPGLDILNPGESQTSDELFSAYLKKHLSFNVNGSRKSFTYIGHEVETGSVFSYLLISDIDHLDRLEIKNDILLETYDDQVNLVHVITVTRFLVPSLSGSPISYRCA